MHRVSGQTVIYSDTVTSKWPALHLTTDLNPATGKGYSYDPFGLLAALKYDGNIDLRLSSTLTLFVQARNIFNRPYEIYEGNGSLSWADNYGSNWVFGVRGQF